MRPRTPHPSLQQYDFNTYGEVFACWIQDVVIVGLIFKHMGLSAPAVVAATAAFGAACAWLFSPACGVQVRGVALGSLL